MDFQFTFKKIDSSKSLMNLAAEKIAPKIRAYNAHCINPHLTFSADRGMQKIHFSMLTGDGFKIEVSHSGPDMYAELDEVANRIESQLRRHKEKLHQDKGNTGVRAASTKIPAIYCDPSWDHVLNEEQPLDASDVLKFENARKAAPWNSGHP